MMKLWAVLAAVLLVAASGLAALGPGGLTLNDAISIADVMAVFRWQHYALHHWPPWFWWGIAMPWLVRPAWLVPASLGIICAGIAASQTGKPAPKRPDRGR